MRRITGLCGESLAPCPRAHLRHAGTPARPPAARRPSDDRSWLQFLDHAQRLELDLRADAAQAGELDAAVQAVEVPRRLAKRADGPAHVAEELPPAHAAGLDAGPRCTLIRPEKGIPVGQPAGGTVVRAEAPRPNAQPPQILQRIAQVRELPVQDTSEAGVGPYDKVAGAVIAVDQSDPIGVRKVPAQPAQPQLQGRVRLAQAVELRLEAVELGARRGPGVGGPRQKRELRRVKAVDPCQVRGDLLDQDRPDGGVLRLRDQPPPNGLPVQGLHDEGGASRSGAVVPVSVAERKSVTAALGLPTRRWFRLRAGHAIEPPSARCGAAPRRAGARRARGYTRAPRPGGAG